MLQQQLLLPPRKPPARIRRSLLRSRAIERVIVKGVARVKVAHLAPCVIKTSSSFDNVSEAVYSPFLTFMTFTSLVLIFLISISTSLIFSPLLSNRSPFIKNTLSGLASLYKSKEYRSQPPIPSKLFEAKIA